MLVCLPCIIVVAAAAAAAAISFRLILEPSDFVTQLILAVHKLYIVFYITT